MFVTKHHHDGHIEVVTNVRQLILDRIERLAVSRRVLESKLVDEQ